MRLLSRSNWSATASLLLWFSAFSSAGSDVRAAETSARYGEPWRPQFHFTPERNWMNDPNGMVFFDGEYHLFYQYNPFGDKWGHMSWGHAVSRDLVRWEHLPLALAEEDGVMIFSGSAVVDWKNTSGFGRDGRPALVALYTGHYTERPLQNQHLAFSADRGRTWTKYAGNPVLDIGEKDFRDPKVFWHEGTQRWVMTVSWPVHRKVRFYASPNLKDWTHLSDFGPAGSVAGIWECPDLFPVSVEGAGRRQRWVLVVNVGSGAPAGGSGCQYFVGDFDGARFTAEPGAALPLWADYGRDFYAAVSWSDVPKSDGRRLWLGWMSNWEYAQDVPTSPWRSAMTVPREVTLRPTPGGLRMVQKPARELRSLRAGRHGKRHLTTTAANAWLAGRSVADGLAELRVEFQPGPAERFGLRLRHGSAEQTTIACDLADAELTLDRSRSSVTDIHVAFPGVHRAPLRLRDGRLRLQVLGDTSSVEVFVNDGETVLSELVFPRSPELSFEVFADDDALRLNSVELWRLKSVWK